ncbi:molybdopterin oxidoreductase family protein [Paenibacillus abyssi]|uniref:Assimilatory nitrate reductase catalytic subunit n=1 Tax=Paenibacillus abyssi TaxID=1340531 RepID=A0A917CNI0_9BACL|nr:molybdopterin oxidoreductase family protein [Paenibacillus abyssi]GGF92156.1 assimilatory nitrate reductase catalytic subunit [Paenibacillus abyssi]
MAASPPIAAQPDTDRLHSHCCYCSMQCGVDLIRTERDTGPAWEVKPSPDFPVATGRLCQKGFNSLGHVVHPERLLVPQWRKPEPGSTGSGWHQASWDQALDEIAGRIQSIQARYGPDAVSVFGGGSLTNEVCYLLGKFTRVALRSRYIDYNGRFCMSSAAAAQNKAFGIDRGLNVPLEEISRSKFIILAGTNIAECQPTMMPYLLAAKKQNAIIVTIDPRQTLTSKIADIHVPLQPGFDSVFVNALLYVILQEKLYDQAFVEEHTNGIDEIHKAVKAFSPDKVSMYTGIPVEMIRTIARGFAKAESGMVLTARGVEQQVNGVEHTLNFINLCLLTGKIGKPGCGYGAVTGQANGQGGREHGLKADQLPGYRMIDDPAAREHVAGVWGIDTAELPGKGVSAYELFDKIHDGEIKAMIVLGSNPVVSSPNSDRAIDALKKLELLVVVDLFETETAEHAHWLLPGTSFLEAEGTLTNLEGRVFHRPQAFLPPGESMPDYKLICELAERLGRGQYFRFESPEAIFDELCRASAGGKADYSGMSYSRLQAEKGLFWPCPAPDHPGTPRMFEDGVFRHPDGRAKLHGIVPGMPAETTDALYPYILTTGRNGSHYLSGTQTRRTEALMKKTPVPVAEIHPSLAEKLLLRFGDRVRLTTRRGSLVFDVKISKEIHPTTVFVPFHWAGEHSINRLTNDALHPISRMPEFKICAVRVERADRETIASDPENAAETAPDPAPAGSKSTRAGARRPAAASS